VQRLRSELEGLIKSLPQNPNITPAGAGYIIQKRHLLSNLTPWYYDYIYQYKLVRKVITTTPIESLERMMGKILTKGKIDEQPLHPDVVAEVKRVWIEEALT